MQVLVSRVRRTPALAPFLAELEARLSSLSHEELKELLRRHARRLPPEDRPSFLEIFNQDVVYPEDVAGPDEDLLEEIASLLNRLKAGEYYQGWGWDPQIHEERAFGDESWAEEMDALFDAAADAFLSGHRALAAEAYGRLLEAFLLEGEPVFCGPRPPQDMVRTDLGEAKARYLRALYESTRAEDRAQALLSAILRLRHVGPHVGIAEMSEADVGPLPDLDAFLPVWIATLEAACDPARVDRHTIPYLLREAVERSAGADGLARLARERGEYQAWIDALLREGRQDEAIAAAREGVDSLESPHARAALADRLGELAEDAGNTDLRLEAARQAWQTEPSLTRLMRLWRAARDVHGDATPILAEEARRCLAGPLPVRPGLACRLLLLTGHYRPALDLLRAAPVKGWSTGDHPARVMLPFLLLASTSCTSPPAGSALEELWTQLGTDWESRETGYRDILEQALMSRIPGESEAAEFLAVATEVVTRRVHAIVSDQHRGAYDRTALLAVALAEAQTLRGDRPGAAAFLARLRAEYPRHVAFQRELTRWTRRSPVLRSAT